MTRLLRSAILAALLAGAASAAWAVPPLLAVIATAAVSYAASAAAVGTIIAISAATASVLTAGIFISTLVYGAVQQRRAKNKAASAYNASLTDRYAPVMSAADAAWQLIYGECTVGPCQVAAQLTSGDRDQFKHVVYVWCAHECDAFVDTLVAGVSVGTLDANGWVTSGKFLKGAAQAVESEVVTLNGSGQATLAHAPGTVMNMAFNTGAGDEVRAEYLDSGFVIAGSTVTVASGDVALWAGRGVIVSYTRTGAGAALLRVRHHLGSPSQTADTALMADCPADWTSADRLRGLCHSIVSYCLDEPEFQSGPPDLKVRLRGKKLYDHRTGTTVYSTNMALATADFLRAEYGKKATTNQMGWATMDAAANVCDESLAAHGGAARYTCNGAFRTDMDPDATLDALCQGMAGFVTWDGTWNMQAGAYTAPVMALTDADNAGSVEVVADRPGDEVFNGLKGRFYDPARFDQLTDYAPYSNAAFVTADGAELWDDLDLPFTNAHWRAHNLARIQVERCRGMQLVYPAKLRALKLKPGQRVTLGVTPLGIPNDAVFRLVKRDYRLGGPVKLTLQQDDPSMYDEADAPAVLDSPAVLLHDPFVVGPVAGLTLTSGAALRQTMADGGVISRVLVTVTASDDALVTAHGALQVEYRLESETAWSRAPEAPGSGTGTTLQGLKDGRRYLVRARWRNGLGAVGDWRVKDVLVDGSFRRGENLLNSDNWVAGSSGNQVGGVLTKWMSFAASAGGASAIVLDESPDESLQPLWYCRSGSGGGAEGGWYVDAIPVDCTRPYRFAVWVLKTGASGGYVLIGADGASLDGALPATTLNTNPYFYFLLRSGLTAGRWYLFTGYILPAGYTGTPALAQVYDGTTGEAVPALSGADFRWHAGTTVVGLRAFQYATGGSGAYMLMNKPRFDMLDGNEPSIATLISDAVRARADAAYSGAAAAAADAAAAAADAAAAAAAAAAAQTDADAANTELANAPTASISGGLLNPSVANGGPRAYGSRTVTPSGGTAPYTYLWTLTNLILGAGGSVFLIHDDTATVSISGTTTNDTNTGWMVCKVTDALGRTATADVEFAACHGSC